ncbi:S8 family serine peptidase [Gorillibacterium sp. sgz5001074]|uniref:S8 family serine peptidase n=1 Tax=Gorillibacterium sp. sgz5001074 TaxID=3446695 RepID=UPI003F66D6E6
MKKRKLSSLMALTMLSALLAPGWDGTASAASSGTGGHPEFHVRAPALERPDLSRLELDSSGKMAMRSSHASEESSPEASARAWSGKSHAVPQTSAGPHSYVPKTSGSGSTTVIVELQAEPLAVYEANVKKGLMKSSGNHRSRIAAEQSAFSAAAERTLGIRVNRTFTKVFNGFSLTLPANRVDALLAMPGVKAVYPSRTFKVDPIQEVTPKMSDGALHIGADAFWSGGYDGSGIRVGVIDSGIDYNHPSLKDAYKGGYDFVDEDDDPMETPPDPDNPNAATFHGTHVSGILAGRGHPDDPVSSTGWIRGVAPGADLYVYRVLGPGGDGTTEDEIAAIERAVEDGMDIINLSMGSYANNQYEADAVAVNNAVLAGTVVVAANGNDGPGDYTISAPAVSEMAISVGSSTSSGVLESIRGTSTVTGSTYYTLYELAKYNTSDYKPLLNRPLELAYAGLGTAADFEGRDWTGKMAFIKRGAIKFVEKIAHAKQAGAAAVLLFNDELEEGYINPELDDFPEYLPAFDMKGSDGRALLSALETAGTGTFTLTGYETLHFPGDTLADSSSRGPALPGYEIKPDLTAPGVGIRSSVPVENGGDRYAYGAYSGTSMAAPHVAGAAALVLDKEPGLKPDEVKSLLMNQAVPMEKPDHARYSLMGQGAGRLDLPSTLQAKAVAMVRETTDATPGGESTEYHTGSLSFGLLQPGETVSRTVDVKSVAGQAASYALSTHWTGAGAGSLETGVTQVQVEAGGSSSFEVTLGVPADTPSAWYEGEILLTGADGELAIPVSVYVPNVVSDIEIFPELFSPNRDEEQDVAAVSFSVNLENRYLSLDVYNAGTGSWVGTLFEEEAGTAPGTFAINDWEGFVWDQQGRFVLPDGSYLIIPWYGDGADKYMLESEAVPFVVDTDAPEVTFDPIRVEGELGTIRGQIGGDLLIDHFGDYRGIFVRAWYKEGGVWHDASGDIEDDGTFRIDFPVHTGENEIEVYVFDAVGNGRIVPALEQTFTKAPPSGSGAAVSAVPSKTEVKPGEPFTVDVRFSGLEDLYSAQFSLTYDAGLTKGDTIPSVTMSVYQQQQDPGSSLIVKEKITALGDGLVRTDYILSMTGEVQGYTGDGILAAFPFQAGSTGNYSFGISDVRFLNSSGGELDPGILSGTAVKVTPNGGGGPVEHAVAGTIRAEGLPVDFDYSTVWYEGADGKLQVTVEALNGQGTVVKWGTVQADGTYALSLPAGSYTIRVRIPGYSSVSQTLHVNGPASLDFRLRESAAGDVSGDSRIDLLDLNRAARAFGKSAPWTSKAIGEADINRDGVVNMLDISYILGNFGSGE